MKIALIGKGLLKTIIDPPRHRSSGTLTIDPPPPSGAYLSRDDGPADEHKALALGFFTPSYRLTFDVGKYGCGEPKELMVTLRARFSDIKNLVLPALKSQWRVLRFINFKCIADYNAKVLKLHAKLPLCNF